LMLLSLYKYHTGSFSECLKHLANDYLHLRLCLYMPSVWINCDINAIDAFGHVILHMKILLFNSTSIYGETLMPFCFSVVSVLRKLLMVLEIINTPFAIITFGDHHLDDLRKARA
ncbi:hypothetical protein ACJX0J_013557, partial [Zea mays]